MDSSIAYSILAMIRDVQSLLYIIFAVVTIPILVGVLAMSAVQCRKATSVVRSKPLDLLTCTTDMDVDAVFRLIVEYSLGSQYRMDHIDHEQKWMILSSASDGVAAGFFYPLYVSKEPSGRTAIEVGAVPKGRTAVSIPTPLTARERERFLNEIRSAIWLGEGSTC